MTSRTVAALAVLSLLAAACSSPSVDASAIPELPATSIADIETLIASSDRPVVVNVWASWCIPCRSEGPLLARAAGEFGADVRFVGLNVRDDQDGARAFIAEFFPEATIEHLYDRRGDIPVQLGASRAVPLTFFYAAGGELVDLHTGVLDERTLALQLDEILAAS